MNMLDIIALAVVIIVALGGYAMGFAKSLKAVTGGIMGVIISVFVCVAFGGALQNLPVIKISLILLIRKPLRLGLFWAC